MPCHKMAGYCHQGNWAKPRPSSAASLAQQALPAQRAPPGGPPYPLGALANFLPPTCALLRFHWKASDTVRAESSTATSHKSSCTSVFLRTDV